MKIVVVGTHLYRETMVNIPVSRCDSSPVNISCVTNVDVIGKHPLNWEIFLTVWTPEDYEGHLIHSFLLLSLISFEPKILESVFFCFSHTLVAYWAPHVSVVCDRLLGFKFDICLFKASFDNIFVSKAWATFWATSIL